MSKKKTNFIWIVLVILGLFLLGSQMGMFSTTPVCISSEPDTLEGYKTKIESDLGLNCPIIDGPELGCGDSDGDFFAIFSSANCNFSGVVGYNYYKEIKGVEIYQTNFSGTADYLFFCTNDMNFSCGVLIDLRFTNGIDREPFLDSYFDTFYTCEEAPEEGKCIWVVNDFCIELWMILVAIGGLFLLIILKR